MDQGAERAVVERVSDRELVVTRTFSAPARIVWDAWTRPELFRRWWAPASFPITLLSVDMDVRVGGGYRMTFGHDGSTMDFFGRYLEVSPPTRLSWSNEEEHGGGSITTVDFEETDGVTRLVVHEVYPSAEALEASSGAMAAMPEQLEQLADLLASVGEPGQPS